MATLGTTIVGSLEIDKLQVSKPEQISAYVSEVSNDIIAVTDSKFGNYATKDDLFNYLKTDYTAFEVFPTKSEIPAGTTDSIESLSALFNWTTEDITEMNDHNCKFTNLKYIYSVTADDTLSVNVKSDLTDTAVIDWGDNIIELINTNDIIQHTYDKSRKYIVKIYGKNIYSIHRKSILISRFMDVDLPFSSSLRSIGSFVKNSLRLLKVDIPYEFDMKSITNLYGLFSGCKNLQQFIIQNEGKTNEKGVFNRIWQSFGKIFENCENLSADIKYLFTIFANWSEDSEFLSCFYNCKNLRGPIDSDVFWTSPYANRYLCKKWGTNPYDGCFEGSALSSEAPQLWGGTNPVNHAKKSLTAKLKLLDNNDTTFTINIYRTFPYTGVSINWGDGSWTYTMPEKPTSDTISLSHDYQIPGEYDITIYGISEIQTYKIDGIDHPLFETVKDIVNGEVVDKKIITSLEFTDNVKINSVLKTFTNLDIEELDLSKTDCKNTNEDHNSTYFLLGCKKLKSVILPTNIHALGSEAFKDCTSLEKIIFPESLEIIGARLTRSTTQDIAVKFNGKTKEEIEALTYYDIMFDYDRNVSPKGNITIYWNKDGDSGHFQYTKPKLNS